MIDSIQKSEPYDEIVRLQISMFIIASLTFSDYIFVIDLRWLLFGGNNSAVENIGAGSGSPLKSWRVKKPA